MVGGCLASHLAALERPAAARAAAVSAPARRSVARAADESRGASAEGGGLLGRQLGEEAAERLGAEPAAACEVAVLEGGVRRRRVLLLRVEMAEMRPRCSRDAAEMRTRCS